MTINVKALARAGARERLKEVEAALHPLLKEQAELKALLAPKGAIPSRANGKWRMTKKRRENLHKMWEGRRQQAIREREERARLASTSTDSTPDAGEPEEPMLPYTQDELEMMRALEGAGAIEVREG